MASKLFDLASRASHRIAKTFSDLWRHVRQAEAEYITQLRKMAERIHSEEQQDESLRGPAPGPPPGRIWELPKAERRTPAEPPTPYEEYNRRFSPLYQRPQSSNVYSFQYDYLDNILYVQYKAPIISPNVKNIGGRVVGELGKTVRSNRTVPRPHAPGFLYAYYGVPGAVFRTLIDGSSPGGGVWDVLRVRGTIHGTQYPYRLVQGSLGPAERGEPAVYVPRRATNRGFRQRAVPALGRGKRPYMQSSLPEQITPDEG